MSYEDDVTAVRRALLRQFREGTDVGAFLVDARGPGAKATTGALGELARLAIPD